MAPSTCSHRPSASHRSAIAVEVVDRPGVDRADRGDDRERLDAGRPVRGDGRRERVDVHRVVVTHRHRAQRGLPEPEQLQGLAVAAVHLGRGVDAEPPPTRDAVGAHLGPDPHGAGHGEPDQVGLRGTGDEQAAGRRGVADGLGAPAHHLLLDEHRGVVGAAHVGVEHAREEVGEVAHRVAGAHVPAPEAGVVVAHRVGHDGAPEVVVGGLQALGGAGEGTVEGRAHGIRHGLPDRLVAPARDVVERVVEHPVREGAERRPVDGVQAGVCVVSGTGSREGLRRHAVMVPPGADGDQSGCRAPPSGSTHRPLRWPRAGHRRGVGRQ